MLYTCIGLLGGHVFEGCERLKHDFEKMKTLITPDGSHGTPPEIKVAISAFPLVKVSRSSGARNLASNKASS